MAKESRETQQNQQKKVFERPDFKALGSVTEITKGTAAGTIDAIFGGIGGFQTPTT